MSRKAEKAVVRGANGVAKRWEGLAEKPAEEIQERMRSAHPRFRRYSVHHRAGAPPGQLLSWDDDGMRCGHSEVSLSHNGSSDVNGSVRLVERRIWNVQLRNDRCERNAQQPEDYNDPTPLLHAQTPICLTSYAPRGHLSM